MSVVSIRVSEQQKGEIEQAALAAKLSIPDDIRQTLATNQNELLKIQIAALKSEGAEVATEVQKLRCLGGRIIRASRKDSRRSALELAGRASDQIRGHLDSDRGFVLGIAGVVGWVLALSGGVLGADLMR